MINEAAFLKYGKARLDDRTITELMGIASGVIADGVVTQKEAEFLQKWIIANQTATANPAIAPILKRLNEMLADKVLDKEEAEELLQILTSFSGGNFELGELRKSTSLYFDKDVEIEFEGARFCFTGTFAYGSRKECKIAVEKKGGSVGNLTLETDYLVVGVYATDSWVQGSFGRKIEKAVTQRERHGCPLIVSEEDWLTAIS